MGLEEQAVIFGAGIVCGAVCGIGADGYRAWYIAVKMKGAVSVWADCLCWCALAALVSVLLFYLNGGDLRIYFFAALAVGYIGYRRLAGECLVRVWLRLARLVWGIARRLRKLIVVCCLPIRAVIRWTASLGRRAAGLLAVKRDPPPEEKS